jgi:hypothetical protein
MRVGYHALVETDLVEILNHYRALSPMLAEDLKRELSR